MESRQFTSNAKFLTETIGINTWFAVCLRKYDFYVGEGIKSKNEYGNPSIDLNKKYWREKHRLWTKDELSIQFYKMIKEYNNEYYKETFEPFNEISGTIEKEHGSVGAVHDIEAVLV